jgi:hypothetical protein
LSNLLAPRVGGLWGGDMTMTGVAGGNGSAYNAGSPSCANAAFDAVIGETIDYRLSITQDGSKLTAMLVSSGTGTGLTCNYEGETGSGGSMVLHTTTCTPQTLTLRCPGEPVEKLSLTGSTLTATFDDPINVTRIQGTAAFNYNVEGSDQSALISNHVFTNFTRR